MIFVVVVLVVDGRQVDVLFSTESD